MNQEIAEFAPTTGNAKLIYILYLVGIVVGVTGIVGVVMAYLNHGQAEDWLKSHYRFQIRTFWIGALFLIIGGMLTIVVIGWFIILFWVVWLIVRSVKGMQYLERGEMHPNPMGWMFS